MSLNQPSSTMQVPGQLSRDLEENQSKATQFQWQGIRDNLQHWQEITQDKILLHAIQHGVKARLQDFPKPNSHKLRNCPAQKEITETTGEYFTDQCPETSHSQGASADQVLGTSFFGRAKKGSEKVHLITDLRDLIQCHHIQQPHPQM